MRKIIFILFLVTSFFAFGQDREQQDWTKNEKSQYLRFFQLANYVYKKQKTEISKDTLFDKYIYFDYVLKDTVAKRREPRLSKFDAIFSFLKKRIDSIGVNNLDAMPIRFYKKHKIYEPFDQNIAKTSISGEKMFINSPDVLVYYRKEDPENPLGTILFEPTTSKLAAWIMIDQGGHKYFLLFNLF